MKKKLSYRDKLLELANIYDVREIKEYVKSKKNLTVGQIELILRKNKIIIPKDYKSNFIKDNFIKPYSKVKSDLAEFKEETIKDKNRLVRKAGNFREDTVRRFNYAAKTFWRTLGSAGINFLNILPKLGKTIYLFLGDSFTNVFNGIYNQQLDPKKAKNVIIGIVAVVIIATISFSGKNYIDSRETDKIVELKKSEIKKEAKKPEIKKEVKKPELKKEIKPKIEAKKKKDVSEAILPNLNLKTETVLNLFKDVEYDLGKVRSQKLVKPIYFTQFPRDLDALQNTKLKKETFIKIVLPLIVAENEKILDDRKKLTILSKKKYTTDLEKLWIRQKLLEYKVKKGDLNELLIRMDVIPTSIALAQAAKESGWGTSRFALEGNAIFGQWTWSGQGIAPLERDSDKKLQRVGQLERDVDRLVRNDRIAWGSSMIACKDADAMVTGNIRHYAASIEKLKYVVEARPGEEIFGMTMIVSKGKTILVADTNVQDFPSSERLVNVSKSCVRVARLFGFDPKVAFLSHSTFGKPISKNTKHVRDAIQMLKKEKVDFDFDGEMQPDVALNPIYQEIYPFSKIVGNANILIMPALHSAAISTKLMKVFGGGKLIGPLLIGLGLPIEVAPLRASTSEILNLASIASYSSGVIDYSN